MRPLTSDIQLYTAQLGRMPIVIFIGAELIGSGVVEDITEMSVAVKGERYCAESARLNMRDRGRMGKYERTKFIFGSFK
ncbi:hypothetical protein SAMN05428961_11022 [Paenibacillus sp. OK060]|uniref:hypothetical protein n=1 Tax=Paenibacillus sp. OK060 TaxID=1881034 RepID=UPI00088D5AF7|nr:hypothetical protein [Paenibacillus sp. OK060]SDM13812.1 hypothetical protein SAMN05428961_11022 [Paenibacillus sp. OK060]